MKRPARTAVLPLLLISPIFLAGGSSSLPILFTSEPPEPISGHHNRPETDRHSQNTQTRGSIRSPEHQNSEITTAAYTNTNNMEASSLVQQQAIASSSFAFPRNLLDFNVTLVGTNQQFRNGNSTDVATLKTTLEILEGFLLGGYLDLTAPIFNLTLTQEGRFQLFPGSLIHTFSYSGTLFIYHLESNWNSYSVQQNQAGLLNGKEAEISERLSNQGIELLVNSISVAPFDNDAVPHDNDQVPMDESVIRTPRNKKDSSHTATYVAVALSLALVAFLTFAFYVRRKSFQIKIQRESALELRRKRMSEGVAEESKIDEDTGSDHTMSSK